MNVNIAITIFLGIIRLGAANYVPGLTYVSEKDEGQNCQYPDLLNKVILAKNIGVDLRRELLTIKEEMEEVKKAKDRLEERVENLEEEKTDADNYAGRLVDAIYAVASLCLGLMAFSANLYYRLRRKPQAETEEEATTTTTCCIPVTCTNPFRFASTNPFRFASNNPFRQESPNPFLQTQASTNPFRTQESNNPFLRALNNE